MTNNSNESNKNFDSGFNNDSRTDACPHCGAEATGENGVSFFFKCGSVRIKEEHRKTLGFLEEGSPTPLCREREKSTKLEAEVERLKQESRVGNIALDNIRGELDLTYQRWREAEKSRDEWMTKAISRSAN